MSEPSYSYAPQNRDGAVVRRLLPATRRRSELARWEVRVDGKVVGWIDEHNISGATATFYFAVGIHPGNGNEYRLEGSTDFGERVRVVRDFHRDPMSSRQHLGFGFMPEYKPQAESS
ncbi:MAG TPA: hypothetical protein PK781_01535 [Terrimesophilobacter sp.]|nr:hypothetical protein [Terrimesophilobacter sp.]HRP99123.1 hypothetical protein [Terrimesophilobacter sp.]